jgi:hypothetical protein
MEIIKKIYVPNRLINILISWGLGDFYANKFYLKKPNINNLP